MAKRKTPTYKPATNAEIVQRMTVAKRSPSGRPSRWLDPKTGKEYSHSQRRQMRTGVSKESYTKVRQAGFNEIRTRAVKRGERIEPLLKRFRDRELIETGIWRKKDAVLKDAAFWEAVDGLDSKGTSPTGKKARALEEFGLRPRNAPWRVGESPKKEPARRRSRSKSNAYAKAKGRA